jgi:putative ABC transport system ATP-binding protein
MSFISIRSMSKSYKKNVEEITVLDNINLSIEEGDFVALMGPSGSGKSTLLNLIAGIDQPTSGEIYIDGKAIHQMTDGQLTRWRSYSIGFIFQFYHLIPVLTAFENVELPLLLTNLTKEERKQQVELALSIVQLSDRMHHTPKQLSGGQEQRVAIARAIVTDPPLLVADEPTGDLDSKNAEEILHLLERLNKEFGKTIIMVTHDYNASTKAKRIIYLEKGQFVNK